MAIDNNSNKFVYWQKKGRKTASTEHWIDSCAKIVRWSLSRVLYN